MNFPYKAYRWVALLFLLEVGSASCKKYLEVKPFKSLAVPSTLNDLQALLDNQRQINAKSTDLIELIADDYYITTSTYTPRTLDQRMNYIWSKDASLPDGWIIPYQGPVYYSNIVLDQLENIKYESKDSASYKNIRGSALFYRSFAFERLAQLYCKPYSENAEIDPGIVLKTSSAISDPAKRASVQQTYDQITNDLKEAASLLPLTSEYPSRPNKAAAYGALARTYLSMRKYKEALLYADLCLQLNSQLIDYNTLVPVKNPPVPRFNPEIIYYNYAVSISAIIVSSRAKIDSNLYSSYATDDLRKSVFFKANTGVNAGSYNFQGTYATGDGPVFDGITTAEMYLIRAEAYARDKKIEQAMADLNKLLLNRYRANSFLPLQAVSAADALNKIITERRKELVFRGLRWSDLRRLNMENANITLKRMVDNGSFELPPNDPRWILLIPQEVINKSGIVQNER